MQIKADKSRYHTMAFYYDYDPNVVDFCRALKEQYGWQQFTFNSNEGYKRWVFSDPLFVDHIKRQYPHVEVDPEVEVLYQKTFAARRAAETKLEKVNAVKDKKDTDLEIKDIKGELYPYQKVGVEFLLASGGRALIADPPGLGKAQSVLSKVITPSGWKTMGELKEGDEVYGQSGKSIKVTGVYPQGVRSLYRVTLRDGSTVLADGEHLWAVKDRNRVKRNMEWDILTTNDLMSRSLKDGEGKNQYMIPFIEPLRHSQKEYEISPYTLGALLGGGSLTQSSVYLTLSPGKRHVLERVKQEHPEYKYPDKKGEGFNQYAFTNGMRGTTPNKMIESLDSFGLRIHSRDRFIPPEYFLGSIEQRTSLLRGLMDTDGSSSKNRITYHTVSKQLADDVADLVRSLGGESNVREYKRPDKTYETEYQVNVKTFDFSPFSQESGKKWNTAKNRRWYGRYIDKIEYEHEGEAVCISVDAPDKLYVTENYIVTHNTLQALAYLNHKKVKRSLVICPASVKASWEKEIKKWTDLSYVVIDSKTKIKDIPKDVRVWVINYDILKKHLDALLKVKFNLLVGDESHLVKSPKAQRTKAVMALAKNIEEIILLSGTPLLSRPVEMFTLLNMIDPNTWNNWYEFTRRYCNGHQSRFGYDTSGASNTEELHTRIKRYFIRRDKKEVLKDLPPEYPIDVPVELDPQIRKQYDEAEEDLATYLFEHKGKQTAEVASAMAAEQLTKLNVLRLLSSIGKIKSAQDLIDSILEADEKVIVFSSFMEPLQMMKEKYGDKAVMLTGSTPQDERGDIVTQFQEDPNKKIFLGGIRSAGVGITLTAANNVLFLDYAWNPSDMVQASQRANRPGQQADVVNIYQLHAEGTVDGRLLDLLKHKQKVFDKVVEGIGVSAEDKKAQKEAMKAVTDDIKTKYQWTPKEEIEALFD